jgi:hypothetical protein
MDDRKHEPRREERRPDPASGKPPEDRDRTLTEEAEEKRGPATEKTPGPLYDV